MNLFVGFGILAIFAPLSMSTEPPAIPYYEDTNRNDQKEFAINNKPVSESELRRIVSGFKAEADSTTSRNGVPVITYMETDENDPKNFTITSLKADEWETFLNQPFVHGTLLGSAEKHPVMSWKLPFIFICFAISAAIAVYFLCFKRRKTWPIDSERFDFEI